MCTPAPTVRKPLKEKLSFLDREYLLAFLKNDRKAMVRLRRAGAKVKVPYYTGAYEPYSVNGCLLKTIVYDENGNCSEEERQERLEEKKESRKFMARDMLEGFIKTWPVDEEWVE